MMGFVIVAAILTAVGAALGDAALTIAARDRRYARERAALQEAPTLEKDGHVHGYSSRGELVLYK